MLKIKPGFKSAKNGFAWCYWDRSSPQDEAWIEIQTKKNSRIHGVLLYFEL